MSYFPNVRDKKIKRFREGKVQEIENPYFQGNLDEEKANLLWAYDVCEDEIEKTFLNLELFEGEFLLAGFDVSKIDMDILAADKGLPQYSREELQRMTGETKIALAFGNAVLQAVESRRNVFVASLLDEQALEREDKHI